MEKLDMKKAMKSIYSSKKKPVIVEVPAIKYVSFEGHGDPNTSEMFKNAMGVLYGTAYTLKFMKKSEVQDFVVMPLEGQWWSDNMLDFVEKNKDNWSWKVMIALPDFISQEDFVKAKESLRKKKNPPMLDHAVLETIEDGESVQVLYVGPYSDEDETIAQLHQFAEDQGYKLRGRHREIYLSNPERTAPEKLKTILRHPVEKIV